MADEQALITAARAGDEAAMEALFRAHVDRAVRLAYLITGDWAAAEDAVQDAFVRAFRSLRRLREGAPFVPWFTSIVVNRARTARAKARNYEETVKRDLGPIPDATPEQTALDGERARLLLNAVRELDEKHRLPILLKYFGGLSEAEVANTLKVPVSTVKSRLFVARQRLRSTLREEGIDFE